MNRAAGLNVAEVEGQQRVAVAPAPGVRGGHGCRFCGTFVKTGSMPTRVQGLKSILHSDSLRFYPMSLFCPRPASFLTILTVLGLSAVLLTVRREVTISKNF